MLVELLAQHITISTSSSISNAANISPSRLLNDLPWLRRQEDTYDAIYNGLNPATNDLDNNDKSNAENNEESIGYENSDDRRQTIMTNKVDGYSQNADADAYGRMREIDAGSSRRVMMFDDDERLSRNDRSLLPEYRNLCETVTRKVELKNDPNYEYQPPHYHEVFCKSYSLMDDEPLKAVVPSKQKCAHPSFHCVQRSRTLFMVRRRWDGECWEPVTKVVASGCDCMWPVSSLGDVSIHY